MAGYSQERKLTETLNVRLSAGLKVFLLTVNAVSKSSNKRKKINMVFNEAFALYKTIGMEILGMETIVRQASACKPTASHLEFLTLMESNESSAVLAKYPSALVIASQHPSQSATELCLN